MWRKYIKTPELGCSSEDDTQKLWMCLTSGLFLSNFKTLTLMLLGCLEYKIYNCFILLDS